MPESKSTPAQAEELAAAFAAHEVDYLFIGKSGTILLGLTNFGFHLGPVLTVSILARSEIVLMKAGPFALDLIHAPDGTASFQAAKSRSILAGDRFPVGFAGRRIASTRASAPRPGKKTCMTSGV